MDDEDVPPPAGRPNDKLIRARQAWAREGRLLTGRTADPGRQRLPPGQRQVTDWPVLDLGIQPEVTEADWSLGVGGLVEHPLRWSWDDFLAQPQMTITTDIHCVTSWSRYDNEWQGVTARHLLGLVKPKAEARFLMLHSHDGYSANLPLERFADEDVLLAWSWQGRPLDRAHGGPVRLVVPRLYFWKSAKWLRAITFSDSDSPGYWERRGYHNDGDPWTEERYS